MKALEEFMQKMKPSADGKFPIAHAVWDGTYTFLFVPGIQIKLDHILEIV